MLYDRSGTGWSDHAELPRSVTEVTDELRSLLRVAGVPAPYVLVGHSLGGIYGRLFAHAFRRTLPASFFSTGSRGLYDQIAEAVAPRTAAHEPGLFRVVLRFKRLYRGYFERMFADWPAPVRDLLFEYHLNRGESG